MSALPGVRKVEGRRTAFWYGKADVAVARSAPAARCCTTAPARSPRRADIKGRVADENESFMVKMDSDDPYQEIYEALDGLRAIALITGIEM
ncbi:hypothetical protein ACIBH1_16590 [Nonomuraea sp. NPDC050663]|uniref:hypothetical protein n=1 Tax=Nonomuraea sp. NPDC050663 TaxID=3364370 RepID=UPI0037893DE3